MISKRKKTTAEVAQEKSKRIMDTINFRASFYRANPHRFCEDYLNIYLKLFQQIILNMFNDNNYSMYIAARGQGKTFLVAVFCVVRCILYPGTRICVVSKTRGQAMEALTVIKTNFMVRSSRLASEIDQRRTVLNSSEAHIDFKNGSLIFVATANENSRHYRANILVCDEFRMIPLSILQTVLRRFLTTPRQPDYLNNPKYKGLVERNKEIYISSAWYQSHWSYQKMCSYFKNMLDANRKFFVCGLPYQISIKENLLSAEQIADEMSEDDYCDLSWGMEMECLWYGDTDGSLFRYNDVAKARKIKQAIYPSKEINSLAGYKQKIPPVLKGNRRIISVDVALLASTKQNNDAASIFINDAILTSDNRFLSNFIYSENHEGLHTNDLALIIRRLYDVYHCTDIALDVKGLGVGVYDALVREIYDPETGVTYSPLSCCNDPVFAERCSDRSAPKVIWAISASAQFNNDMYLALREGFMQNKINLLISESDSDDLPSAIGNNVRLSPEEKTMLLMPYIHTSLFIRELVSLECSATGTLIKVSEKSGMRKDRVSSIGYNYWVVREIERSLKPKKANEVAESNTFVYKRPVLRKNYGGLR